MLENQKKKCKVKRKHIEALRKKETEQNKLFLPNS